jgi:hypothetical protein
LSFFFILLEDEEEDEEASPAEDEAEEGLPSIAAEDEAIALLAVDPAEVEEVEEEEESTVAVAVAVALGRKAFPLASLSRAVCRSGDMSH